MFGFDLMVDEAMQVWLLEVNLSPGCDVRTPFLERMLIRMTHRLVEIAVLGREDPDGVYPDWLRLGDTDSGDAAALAAAEAVRRPPPERPGTEELKIRGQTVRLRRPAQRKTTSSSATRSHASAGLSAEEIRRLNCSKDKPPYDTPVEKQSPVQLPLAPRLFLTDGTESCGSCPKLPHTTGDNTCSLPSPQIQPWQVNLQEAREDLQRLQRDASREHSERDEEDHASEDFEKDSSLAAHTDEEAEDEVEGGSGPSNDEFEQSEDDFHTDEESQDEDEFESDSSLDAEPP